LFGGVQPKGILKGFNFTRLVFFLSKYSYQILQLQYVAGIEETM